MEHEHSVTDFDKHFSIDTATREIINESGKIVLVQGDHKSERFTFKIPRYVDGHDMSLCNLVQVHYTNTEDKKDGAEADDVYETGDLQIDPYDKQNVIFTWLITANATQYIGPLVFSITYACVADDGTIEYSWSTIECNEIEIKARRYNSNAVAANNIDVLAKWRGEMFQMVQDQIDMTVDGTAYVHTTGDTMTGNLSVPNPTDAAHAANKEYVDELKAKTVMVTLFANGWSSNQQNVSVESVTANNTVIVSPTPASHLVYCENNVRCIAQSLGSLTFQCENVPSEALTVNVTVLS